MKIKATNKQLIGRLENHNFSHALFYTKGEDKQIKKIVGALAETFGDGGGLDGNMALIVDRCIASIIPE